MMKKIALAIAAISLTGTAFAQSYYVEGSIGQGQVNEDCSGIPSCSKSSTGYKLVGGYKFGNNLSAELLYVDYGKSNASDSSMGFDANVKVHGLGVGVAYAVPFLNQWAFTIRGGVASNHLSANASTYGNAVASASKTKTAPYLGLEVGFDVNKNVAIVGSYDVSHADDTTGNLSVSLLSLGLKYSF